MQMALSLIVDIVQKVSMQMAWRFVVNSMQTAKCANGFKLRRRQYLKKLMQMALSLELDSMRKA